MLVTLVYPPDVHHPEDANLPAWVTSRREYTFEAEGETDPLFALEKAYAYYNADNRPNGQEDRSMSVGDLGLIDGQWYLCSVFGFKKITKEQAEKVEAMDFRDRLFLRNGADIETLPAVLAMGRERHSPSKFPR